MTHNLRLTPIVLVLMLGSPMSCKVHNDALQAEILGAVLPDQSCQVSATNPTYQEGFYDPTVDGGMGYAVNLSLRNNMQTPQDEQIASGPVSNIVRRAHDLQVTSVDACWFFAQDEDTFGVSGEGGEIVDCSKFPQQSARLQAFGHIDEGGGVGLLQTTVLSLAHLQALFGASYAPQLIPSFGAFEYSDPSINPSVAGGNQPSAIRNGYRFGPDDPTNLATRSVYWGAKHPTTRTVNVDVQMRVNLQMQSGELVQSNWFALPINVCTGCLQDYCGPLIEKVCARGPCADGTECLSTGLCANTALTCSPLTLYSGARPNFYATTLQNPCKPAQLFPTTPLTCMAVGCDAQN